LEFINYFVEHQTYQITELVDVREAQSADKSTYRWDYGNQIDADVCGSITFHRPEDIGSTATTEQIQLSELYNKSIIVFKVHFRELGLLAHRYASFFTEKKPLPPGSQVDTAKSLKSFVSDISEVNKNYSLRVDIITAAPPNVEKLGFYINALKTYKIFSEWIERN
jgi:hypothetical protein